jgi:hypothetical protein
MSATTNRFIFSFCVLFFSMKLTAQENSPFSRYGIGDLYPNESMASRAMGGLTSAFADGQALNTNNPATYANIALPTYDLGFSIDARTLRDNSLSESSNSVNFSPAYITLGFPISRKHKMGFVLGLKPISRVSYNVSNYSSFTQQTGVQDSLLTNYFGNGGLNSGFVGFGKQFGSLKTGLFRIGFNTGLNFGKKDINTVVDIINDTIAYHQSNSEVSTAFWGMFINAGVQYDLRLKQHTNPLTKDKDLYLLRLGADVNFQQTMHANQTQNVETFYNDANGNMVKIDSIFYQTNILGNVSLPSTYNAGLMFVKITNGYDKWMFGGQYEAAKWSQYRFYGQPDRTIDNWTIRAGGQYCPQPGVGKSSWSRATYRAGFFKGLNYIDADGNGLKETGFTLGIGFPVKPSRTSYSNEYTLINTALEIGKRGTSVNQVTENYFKLSVGLSLSDRWFIKRKYD